MARPEGPSCNSHDREVVGQMFSNNQRGPKDTHEFHVGPAGLTLSLPLRVLTSFSRPDGRGYYIAALRASRSRETDVSIKSCTPAEIQSESLQGGTTNMATKVGKNMT